MFEISYDEEQYSINTPNTYSYNLGQNESELYIFELLLNKFNDKTKTIRKIARSKSGNLISCEDNINYDTIKNISLTAIDINNPTNEINIDFSLDHNTDITKILNKNIRIELLKDNINMLICNYIIKKFN